MATCWVLKKYNIFFYNETGMVDPAFTSRSTLSIDLDAIESGGTLHNLPLPVSHLPPPLHGSPGKYGPHSPQSLVDQLAAHTGHGLLGGKVRKAVAYPHSFASVDLSHMDNDVYYKKGK